MRPRYAAFERDGEGHRIDAFSRVGLQKKIARVKVLFAHAGQKIADGRILPQLDKGVDLPGLPAHPEIQLVQHRENHEDAQARRRRDLIQPNAEGKTRAGTGPETGRRGQTLDLVALGHNDRTRAQKADAVDDLRSQTRRVSGLVGLVKKLVRHHDDAGTETDEHIRPQAGPAVFHAALHAENAAEEDRQNDPDGDLVYVKSRKLSMDRIKPRG